MRLLLSLFDDPLVLVNGTARKSSLLLVDTYTGKKRPICTPVLESQHAGATGMDYSGDWLCLNLFNLEGESVFSHLYLTHLDTGKTALHSYRRIHHAQDVVSVYPGQVYVNCIATDTMVGDLFSPATGQLIREDPHFTLPEGGCGRYGFTSMCSYRNKWYAAITQDGQGRYNGAVFEMSTQRAIYSNCNKPNSIFFNSNHRLCFCESGAGNVHLGDLIIHVGGYPQGIIEDRDAGGYWVAVQLTPGTRLLLVKYNGAIAHEYIELDDLRVFKIIEARGQWLKHHK